MSRAKAAAERAPLDFYATPDALALAICGYVFASEKFPALVVEPSAGEGPFVRAAKATWDWAEVTAIDIDPTRTDALFRAGADRVIEADFARFATLLERPEAGGVTFIGNPPYREAEAHIRAARRWMTSGDVLVFLLRINFLGSTRRLQFWAEHPATWIAPIIPRPSFTGGGSDGTEYAAFCWRGTDLLDELRQQPPTQVLRPIVWTP